MSVRPDCAALVLLEPQMVDVAHDGLEEQQRKENEPNNGMILAEQADLSRSLLG